MKDVIEKLILTQINSLLNERKKLSTNPSNVPEANIYEDSRKRDDITRELSVWQMMLQIIEKLN